MAIISSSLFVIGFLIGLFFGIKILIIAFRKSVVWGLASLFIPFVALVFVIMHWDETKKPFLCSLLAIPLYILGGILAPAIEV